MNTRELTSVLPRILTELTLGSPDPAAGTVALNRGDEGLLKSLDKVSSGTASVTRDGSGSIASHTEHLRYGFSLLNRWASGADKPWAGADWTLAWKKPVVTDDEWRTLRGDLGREVRAYIDHLRTPRDVDETELAWIIGSIAHVAYHVGAIRQLDRATRGPTAEDEPRYESVRSS